MTIDPAPATLVVAPSKEDIGSFLAHQIIRVYQLSKSSSTDGKFKVALSGGSLPKFLAALPDVIAQKEIGSPKDFFSNWHVYLADERCVPSTHPDSNMGALKHQFLNQVHIPENQIYGINESLLKLPDNQEKEQNLVVGPETANIAQDYEQKLPDHFDLAILGFGPDGHTCSLFPGHALLKETKLRVAPITDSPKPPPCRITLTLPVLNEQTSHVIFCGAGSSKSPVMEEIMPAVGQVTTVPSTIENIPIKDPPPLPCAAVRPKKSLTWLVDVDAMKKTMP